MFASRLAFVQAFVAEITDRAKTKGRVCFTHATASCGRCSFDPILSQHTDPHRWHRLSLPSPHSFHLSPAIMYRSRQPPRFRSLL